MNSESKKQSLAVLAGACTDLDRLARSSEADIQSVAQAFKKLATQAGTILQPAAAIVANMENESINAVLGKVRSLCLTVRDFLEPRLDAASRIMELMKGEDKLLSQLTLITRRQPAIAFNLKALSMHTNIEVAQLGSVESDFQLLAQELSEFSTSASQQTLELASHTETRKQTVAKIKQELAADLAQLRSEMAGMEKETARTLQIIDASLAQMAEVPRQFRTGADETALQIAGVISAIQSHDITRQQIEHVQTGLQIVASQIDAPEEEVDGPTMARAGLNIQICQMKIIKATLAGWISQIGTCMAGIQQLSASDLVGIGAMVLRQEKELTSQLAQIELLQKRSQDYGDKIRHTLTGLASLIELINEYLRQSHAIRERLQLLTFNSLIEANRLGQRGVVVSAIAKLIERVSTEWDLITEHSRLMLNEIMNLVKQTDEVMEVFSEARSQPLREGQAQTTLALSLVRTAAIFVAKEAEQMQSVTHRMQSDAIHVNATGEHLNSCFEYLEGALSQLEELHSRWQADESDMAGKLDLAEAERLFSPFYTTEIERRAMHAALNGAPLPVVQQSFAGNTIELF